jgi:hypothetical protein
MPEPSTIDARLAEIDRRLRTIQTDLKPGDPPAGGSPSGPAAPDEPKLTPPTPLRAAPQPAEAPPPADAGEVLVDHLQALGAAHERLLDLHRELLEQYAGVLDRAAAPAAGASVTAGPFADAAAVRAFEQGLRTLPGVTAVTVKEYLGPDRVALEVSLAAR